MSHAHKMDTNTTDSPKTQVNPSVGSGDLLAALVRAQDEYIELLSAELSDVMPLAYIHHWRSKRIEAGASARRKIAELRSAANIVHEPTPAE